MKMFVKVLALFICLAVQFSTAHANTFDLKLKSVNEKSLLLTMYDINENTSISIIDSKGIRLHSEEILSGYDSKIYDLSRLDAGSYSLQLEDDTKFEAFDLVIGVAGLEVENQASHTYFKPVMSFKEGKLKLDMLSTSTQKVTVAISDSKDAVVFEEVADAENHFGKIYDLNQLPNGRYWLTCHANGESYRKVLDIK